MNIMAKLVIVSCGSKKIWNDNPSAGPTAARDAYVSPYTNWLKSYPQKFKNDWFILSAKYGFIEPDFIIPEPYNLTFKDKSARTISVEELREQVRSKKLNRFDEIVVLGGKEYANRVRAAFAGTKCHVRAPVEGLPIGKIMKRVKESIIAAREL